MAIVMNMKGEAMAPTIIEPIEAAWNGLFEAIERLITIAETPGFAHGALVDDSRRTYAPAALKRHVERRLAFVWARIEQSNRR